MKKAVIFMLVVFLVQTAAAINLEIQKEVINDVVVTEFENPAVFLLKIKNNGQGDYFQIFNLHGVSMLPEEEFFIASGKSKEIQLMIYPRKDLDYGRFFQRYSFNFFIQDSGQNHVQETVSIKISKLKDAFEITASDLDPESEEIKISLINKADYDFGDISVRFFSGFFSSEEQFNMGPNEKKETTIKIDKEKSRELVSGFYTVKGEIFAGGHSAIAEGIIKFTEKNLVTESQKKFGIIINTETIETINEGNTVAVAENTIQKNILSRLFTNFNIEPDRVEREGFFINYYWTRQIRPGESLIITSKTNWMFPILFLTVILVLIIFLKHFSKKEITMKKKVNFMRAKGGEFALKISVFVQANKYVERVNIIDSIPPLVKVFERYGAEKPTRIDEKNRRIDWNFEKLEAGEVRILTYVIYSKVGVMGKFALPSATAVYEREGKIKEVRSNKAFFVAEQRKGEIQE
jgi:hypothetical protein